MVFGGSVWCGVGSVFCGDVVGADGDEVFYVVDEAWFVVGFFVFFGGVGVEECVGGVHGFCLLVGGLVFVFSVADGFVLCVFGVWCILRKAAPQGWEVVGHLLRFLVCRFY